MALKTIRVRIKSVDEALDNAIGTMRAIQSKRRVRKRVGEYFESLDAVRAALTEKRIALLRLGPGRAPPPVAGAGPVGERDFQKGYPDLGRPPELGVVTHPPQTACVP